MSEKQHLRDLQDRLPHKQSASASGAGGQCLNRHEKDVVEGNSCSHRWQAYLQMRSHHHLYNYPAYKPLCDRERPVRTSAMVKEGKKFPGWYRMRLEAPQPGEWNVERGVNFQKKCYIPYWHNAHHLVPNSALRKVIEQMGADMPLGSELVKAVKRELLLSGYNLNYRVNMIMLPMDDSIAGVLRLPRHLVTADSQNHRAYSANVERELQKILQATKQRLQAHDKANYPSRKEQLEALSRKLYRAVVAARTGRSLDEINVTPAERPT